MNQSGYPVNNFFHVEKRGSVVTRRTTKSKFYVSKTLPLAEGKPINFHFTFFELVLLYVCPCLSWKNFTNKKNLLNKAKTKLFFQLDVLNYLKKMQLLELLTYALLDPEESIILHFLSKPSISLAQKSDLFEKINKVNAVNSKEVNELYTAMKDLEERENKTEMQKRLYNLAKSETGMWIKRVQNL